VDTPQGVTRLEEIARISKSTNPHGDLHCAQMEASSLERLGGPCDTHRVNALGLDP
jgi:hypothetical protein